MLTQQEISLVTGGSKNWRLIPASGGFQGTNYYLCDGNRKWFIKTETEGGSCENLRVFVKEPLVYKKILPLLQKHLSRREQLWPEVFLARKGAMVLEDLTTSGWSIPSSALDCEHVKVALESFADFHGASIMLDREKALLPDYSHVLRESYFGETSDHPGLRTWTSFISTSEKIYAEYFPGSDVKRALKIMKSVPEMVKPSRQYINCICHGDPWKNNIFFKYDFGRPIAACFVDFAQVRYTPPSLDVLLFLKQLQVDDTKPFLLHYHSRIQKIVTDFCRDDFLNACCEAMPFALAVAPLYVYLTRLPDEVIKVVTRSQEDFWEFATGKDEPAMEAIKSNNIYRNAVLKSFKELLDYSVK